MTTTNLQNPWKYVQADSVKDNPYLNPPKGKKENGKKPVEEPAPTGTPTVTSAADFLVLENIVCVGADKKIFERHDKLYVAKDVERNGNAHVDFTPYEATTHFEKKGLFLPSFALTCNLVAALYQNKGKADVKKVLEQYKDHGAGYGWQAQNTVIDWERKKIIHYPHDKDFPENGGDDKINAASLGRARTTFSFIADDFEDMLLEEALKKREVTNYIRNLTGLKDPSILVEIGKYFGQPTKMWVPDNPVEADYTASAWFGCSSNYFYLLGNLSLNNYDAARGVRGERQRAGAQKTKVSPKKKSSTKNSRKK
ncbi:MAG TPA: hypothetical protein VJI32_03515 [Candidatus Nanoarchaeia archaeon]|nr:hypothetical protein [Candidatus Nanoarchaeia archaeon]